MHVLVRFLWNVAGDPAKIGIFNFVAPFMGFSSSQVAPSHFLAGAALELPMMAELTEAGQYSLKRAIYDLGGRKAVAQQYNFDCKL